MIQEEHNSFEENSFDLKPTISEVSSDLLSELECFYENKDLII